MERLAALEAEVTADAEAQSARKAAAVAKLRDQRVTQTAERDQLRARQAELVSKKPTRDEPRRARRDAGANDDATSDANDDQLEGLGGALELATKANRVKNELSRTPRKGDKSWIASGVASLALGPIGWLYAGSLREAVPAATATMLLAAIASKILPAILLWPALMVVMPLSAIAGVVYAMQYNRKGRRQRLFEGDKAKAKVKQLRGS